MLELEKRKWVETSDNIERTEVLYDFEDILACALDILPKIRKTHDLCLDNWGPSVVLGTEVVKNAFITVHNRGAKIRLITEITSANIGHCKEFMNLRSISLAITRRLNSVLRIPLLQARLTVPVLFSWVAGVN